ncbi:metal ABC transporter ATPase, partial [Pseudomonas sp. MWU12-2312b]
STRGLYLAESFATQEGWVVREERIRWKDWLVQQGLQPAKPPRPGLKQLSLKALRLVGLGKERVSK